MKIKLLQIDPEVLLFTEGAFKCIRSPIPPTATLAMARFDDATQKLQLFIEDESFDEVGVDKIIPDLGEILFERVDERN